MNQKEYTDLLNFLNSGPKGKKWPSEITALSYSKAFKNQKKSLQYKYRVKANSFSIKDGQLMKKILKDEITASQNEDGTFSFNTLLFCISVEINYFEYNCNTHSTM